VGMSVWPQKFRGPSHLLAPKWCQSGVCLSEGQWKHGVLQDSCKAMGRGWFGVVCVCVGHGHPLVSVWCVDVGVCVCVGFVCRWWVGVAMLWHDSEYDDVWNAMRVWRVV
jgi:hypothetical protein